MYLFVVPVGFPQHDVSGLHFSSCTQDVSKILTTAIALFVIIVVRPNNPTPIMLSSLIKNMLWQPALNPNQTKTSIKK